MRPDDGVRTDNGARRDLRPFHDHGGRMNADAVRHESEQQHRFGDDLIPDVGLRPRFRQPRSCPHERHLEAQAIARHHLLPEFRLIDAVQVHARHGMRSVALEQQRRGNLCERFQHQHAGHERRAGKMPLEEVLVDRDVLVSDEALSRLVLGDAVDEQRRMAITEAVEQDGNIDGHGGV